MQQSLHSKIWRSTLGNIQKESTHSPHMLIHVSMKITLKRVEKNFDNSWTLKKWQSYQHFFFHSVIPESKKNNDLIMTHRLNKKFTISQSILFIPAHFCPHPTLKMLLNVCLVNIARGASGGLRVAPKSWLGVMPAIDGPKSDARRWLGSFIGRVPWLVTLTIWAATQATSTSKTNVITPLHPTFNSPAMLGTKWKELKPTSQPTKAVNACTGANSCYGTH